MEYFRNFKNNKQSNATMKRQCFVWKGGNAAYVVIHYLLVDMHIETINESTTMT